MTRILLFTISLLALSACSRVPDAPDLSRPGLLGKKESRQLVEHWSGRGFPSVIGGHPVRLIDHHANADHIRALTPADDFSKDDKNKRAIGTLAMVHPDPDRYATPLGSHLWEISSQPATVIATVNGDQSVTLDIRDFRETPTLDGRTLAARPELAFDYIKDNEPNALANILALIKPRSWSGRRGFYLGTPYDPDKIPLVFVHGLLSTPVAFDQLASAIAAEPDLWDRYQFWYYFYPTGDPWVLSAANFRKDFRNLVATLDPDGNDRNLRHRTTIIAHSMGGLLTRLSISENPQPLYDQYFSRPLDELRLLPYQKKRIREQLLFEPLTEPSRVIFLATPHQGSQLAGGPLLWLARVIVQAPARILGTTLSTAQILAFAEPGIISQPGYALLTGNEVSVNGLNPESPCLKCLEKLPLRKDVELHNIIASLGGPDGSLGDGIVPLQSARLKQADSEHIIRGHHWLIYDPKVHELVKDILRK